uniref:Bactericidal-permeability-increasing protein 4 n=1 Tax=Euprymna scolopes TaxID=6613 RepID=A0A1D8BMA5_EUPSC|nr:bactericidal-permeability-increasing protein 4 [Euprymna scolopes]
MFFAKCLTALLFAITVCFFLNIGICRANPGIRVQITQKGLNYANNLALRKMYKELKNYKFPDFSKGGSTSYRLYNIKVSRVSRPRGHIALVPGQGLRWTVVIKGYRLSAKFKLKQKVLWFTIRKTFSVTMKVKRVELKFTLKPSKATNGGLKLKASRCRSKVDVNVSAKNIVLKIILKFFRRKINRIIEKKLCQSATKIINNDVSRKLARFPVTRRIKHGYFFDYGFVSNPVFTSNYMQTNHKAAILDKNKNGQFPFAPPQLPQLNENKKMIYFIISDYVLNTWLYTAYHDNQLWLKVNSKMFKKENQRAMFQTTCPNSMCIGKILPQIAEKYPNSKMEMHFTTYENPMVHFKANHVQLNVPVRAEFIVVQANGAHAKLLTAELVLFSEVKTKISGKNLLLTVSETTLTLKKIYGGAPGSFAMIAVKGALEMIVKFVESILPGQQFPLVLPSHAMLSNPTIRIVQNAIIVASDLNIKSI